MCAGSALECNDSNACTKDSCTASKGCQNVATADTCNDGNACTLLDVCSGGACKGGNALNCDDNNPCTTDSCDPKSGCKALANTASCSDGNACTSGDVCVGGACKGKAVVCNDNNPCTDDSCGPTGCEHPANFQNCDDGNICTVSDFCVGGTCAGEAKSCDDFNPCTNDSCDKVKGCMNLNAVGGSCNDGDACTSQDICGSGVCKGSAITCNDANVCTNDSCDKTFGCTHDANTAGCDDGNICTEGDVCASKACGAGPKVKGCDDKNPCTFDSCDKAKGCTYLTGAQKCDDGNPCTTDSCDAGTGACKHEKKANCCTVASECDDGKPCSKEGCMADGTCKVVSDACCVDGAQCNDGQLCTTDTCVGGVCKSADAVPCPGLVTQTWDFEDGSPQFWTLSAPNATYGIGWSVLGIKGTSGEKSLFLGTPGGAPFANVSGTTNLWTAESPEVSLPAGRAYKVEVVWRIDVKATTSTYNRMDLKTVYSTTSALKATKLYSQAGWQTETFNIDELSGAKFKLRLEARLGALSSSTTKASGTGFYLDSVKIMDGGPAKSCKVNLDCGNPASCASGTCNAGVCSYEAKCCTLSTECNDGKPCTTDLCSSGLCLHSPKAGCCSSSAQCDDGKPCTLDSCNNPAAAGGGTCSSEPGYGCCASASDCKATSSPCFAASCNAGLCSYAQTCCAANSECNDNDAVCTSDACVNGKCVFTPTNAQGCCTPKVHEETFETSPAAGWTFENSAGPTKGWQVWTDALYPTSGKGALYYGDPLTKNYEFSGSNFGTATFKTTLPAAKSLTLAMSIRMDTEVSASYDNLVISKVVGGVKTTLWSKTGDVAAKHFVVTIDLSSEAGKAIDIQLTFSTGDGVANATAGVHIDDFKITRSCP